MPAGWSTIEIDIADHLIDREGLVHDRVLNGAEDPAKGQLPLNAIDADAIKRNLTDLFARHLPGTSTAALQHQALELRRQILDLLAAAAEIGSGETTRTFSPNIYQAYRLVRKARGVLDEQLPHNPTIDSVAFQLGVTTRTLQRAFLIVLGASPKQYFLARKLDVARRILRRSGSSVVDVAHDLGFASASRFAEQFSRQFGQTPSTVIRLTPRPPSPSP